MSNLCPCRSTFFHQQYHTLPIWVFEFVMLLLDHPSSIHCRRVYLDQTLQNVTKHQYSHMATHILGLCLYLITYKYILSSQFDFVKLIQWHFAQNPMWLQLKNDHYHQQFGFLYWCEQTSQDSIVHTISESSLDLMAFPHSRTTHQQAISKTFDYWRTTHPTLPQVSNVSKGTYQLLAVRNHWN